MGERQAAHVGSTTAHGGAVTEGFDQVLINGHHAARMGDRVGCSVHGPGTIASGNATVLVGNQPLARLLEPVKCVPSAPGVEPLVDHGTPRAVVGKYELHAEAGDDMAELPEKELQALLEALDGGGPKEIYEAWDNLPLSAKSFVTKFKVVDRSSPKYPNEWKEIELSGPGGSAATLVPGQIVDVRPREGGGVSVHAGGSVQAAGVKVTNRERSRDESGAVVEDWGQVSKSIGFSAEARLDLDWDWDRIGFAVDGKPGGVASMRDTIVPADGGAPSPATNQIVAATSENVMVGAG